MNTNQQISVYISIILSIAGIIGNGINIFVFTSEVTYRKTPCTFYFLVSSISNLFLIIIALSNRILNAIYGIDYTLISNIWCKTRQFSLVVFNMISITCLCFASIDQFLVTSRNHSLRRCSQIKWSYRIVLITIILWILNGIPILIYQNISLSIGFCMPTNSTYAIFTSVFFLVFMSIIPILIMTLFGWLTYRNIQRTIVLLDQNVDQQLVTMTFIQILLVIVSFLPYGIYMLYIFITTDWILNANQLYIDDTFSTSVNLIVNLFNNVCFFVNSFNNKVTLNIFQGNCYVFLLSSRRFRQTVKRRLFCWQRHNQIGVE